MVRLGIVILAFISLATCNTVVHETNVVVPSAWNESMTTGTWVCSHNEYKKGDKSPEFHVNMNFQASEPVTFLVRENYRCFTQPFDVAISDLSVYNATSYRGYRIYTSQEMTLCYQFQSRSINWNTTVYLNYTLDLCCNLGCSINANAAPGSSIRISLRLVPLLQFLVVLLFHFVSR